MATPLLRRLSPVFRDMPGNPVFLTVGWPQAISGVGVASGRFHLIHGPENRKAGANRTDRNRVAGPSTGRPALRVRSDNRKRPSIRSEKEKARAIALAFFRMVYLNAHYHMS